MWGSALPSDCVTCGSVLQNISRGWWWQSPPHHRVHKLVLFPNYEYPDYTFSQKSRKYFYPEQCKASVLGSRASSLSVTAPATCWLWLSRPRLQLLAAEAEDDGGHPRPGHEALHEQAHAVRAPRDLQLPPDLLHRGQRQEEARHHRRPQQLRLRRWAGRKKIFSHIKYFFLPKSENWNWKSKM